METEKKFSRYQLKRIIKNPRKKASLLRLESDFLSVAEIYKDERFWLRLVKRQIFLQELLRVLGKRPLQNHDCFWSSIYFSTLNFSLDD
ncbi:hypothetical protein T10_7178 [Trichinella papuae]|uniref:Uncharacterized protein n=1 Tax=Trichinella papuae TaxID=268474 RepID=A0A0V1MYJ9_9BILA|nr:hypothetical protein T10_7178 [Trichinella papuae]